MELYEMKRVSELIQRMNEAKNVHELNKLYNDAEKVLFLVYETFFERLTKFPTIER